MENHTQNTGENDREVNRIIKKNLRLQENGYGKTEFYDILFIIIGRKMAKNRRDML